MFPFSCWSCNVGRGSGPWDILSLAILENIDVVAIQDDGLSSNERCAFYRTAENARYRIYAADSIFCAQGARGGAMLLVKSQLRSSFLSSLSLAEGQSTTAIVENVAISSIYQPPSRGRLTLAEHLQEVMIVLPRTMPWICVGDHNDIPSEHVLLQGNPIPGLTAVYPQDADNIPLPTRWEGTRCIDYYITNNHERIRCVSIFDDAVSDHKIVTATILSSDNPADLVRPFRLAKAQKIHKPESVDWTIWEQACQEFMDRHPPPVFPHNATQEGIDELWNQTSLFYERMLLFAQSKCNGAALRQVPSKNKIHFANHLPSHGQMDRANDEFVVRKLRNFIAKIRELLKLQTVHRTHTAAYTNLVQKLRRSPFFQLGIPWKEQLDLADQALQREKRAQYEDRLRTWRNKMQTSVRACYKWLKNNQYVPFRGLFSAALNRNDATRSIHEALTIIRDHWRLVWRRPQFDLQNAINRIDNEINRLHFDAAPHHWQPLTAEQLATRAARLKGKAAGPDNWAGDELASIPAEHMSIFADFCQLCEMVGFIPTQWTFAVQCHLPKAQKGLRESDGARDVNGLRPLTLFSSWYRLWASTRLKSDDAQAWISNWWHPSAVGGKKGKEIYHALLPLISAASQGEFIISLDFSLAFDYCDPKLATYLFSRTGMPQNLCNILSSQWLHQQRIITFDGFCLPEFEQVTCSLPQGDPFSLIAMVAVMMPPMCQIARDFPSVTQRNFVDDRTWAAPNADVALQVEQLWSSWSATLNLRENFDKNQYYHKDIAGRRRFTSCGAPAGKVSDHICVLGHVFSGVKQRALVPKERERFANALHIIRRAAFLPLPVHAKRAVIAAGPLSKAEFGWCMHAPPLTECDKIDKAVRKSLKEPKQSSVDLRTILRGHRLDTRFRILSTCINALHRTCNDITFPAWSRIGLADTINKFLNHMSWLRDGMWQWTHSVTGACFALDPANNNFVQDKDKLNHLLREGFRAHHFSSWLASKRNDAEICAGSTYSESRCQACRKSESFSAHRFAIHTGGFVSPAAFGVQTHTDRTCLCGGDANLDHILWECPMVPNVDQRPPIPQDWLQRRLGWPCGSPFDEAVIGWMVSIRQFTLTNRYKPPLE